MKTKAELLTAVDQIPTFEFKEVALAPVGSMSPSKSGGDTWTQVPVAEARAITEEGKNRPLTFVSGRYQLIQFKPAFEQIITEHSDCSGNLYYNEGFAVLDTFPQGEDYLLPNGQQIGISAYNSVNKTSALIIRFSVTDGGRVFTLPKNISSYYRAHVGQAAEQQKEYIQMLGRIKDMWITAVNDMSKTPITIDNWDTYAKQLTTNPRIMKAIKLEVAAGSNYNLWSLAMRIYDEMQKGFAKSDIHKRKRIDSFIESLTVWGTIFKIGGN